MDLQRIVDFTVARLAGDATLTGLGVTGVYDTEAPHSARYPFVLVYETGASTVRGVGSTIIMTNALLGVRAVVRGESAHALSDIVDRFDTLLTGVSMYTAELEVIDLVRDSETRRVYSIDGVGYRELGGLYRCFARRSN